MDNILNCTKVYIIFYLTPVIMRLEDIYVRPGVGQAGVGLICIRAVPKGKTICTCASMHSRTAQRQALAGVPGAVRNTIHEMFDGWTGDSCTVPTDFDQSIPLASFINHSARSNCRYDEVSNTIVAVRRLRCGEEATVNYMKYQDSESYTYRYAASEFTTRPM